MQLNNLCHTKAEYVSAIKKLFPLGAYWDVQFNNPYSDLSVWVDAKSEELHRFKNRFSELITESTPKTADTTLDDWERILLGTISPHLPVELRRSLLLTKGKGFVNKDVLERIGNLYGVSIKRVYFPYRSAFCGHTRIGINQICSPASFSLIFIESSIDDVGLKDDFERSIREALLANIIVYFFYE